ncbi:mRNA cap guanine-N7 methyltransferase [Hylaeus anthracinus]|uniref:mRNA cap guanine-N7 methyltransferase n=1 Tax=Hylaeus anthracinus TaxID=313031 RepID=UPI0023B9F1E4|nr:mRNA cap guanine-N7 methyltransferase [Hylaeus anthracinus]
MSAPCLDATKEAKEKQDASSSEQSSIVKKSPETSSQTSSLKKEREPDTNDNSCIQPEKRRIAGSPDPESSKLNNTPSDLSSGSSREKEEPCKSEANTDNTQLIAEHYNMIEDKGLSCRNQSRILYMRNFNNWIKSMLISEYIDKVKQDKVHGSSLKVLDMCCGKGGDLLKWKKGNVTHVICTDLAKISVDQCQNRYNELVNKSSNDCGFDPIFTAEFIVADCTKGQLREKYKDASVQLDLVSCQFAFHYSFETLPQAECMIKNASECLRTGGYFIGTIPDAYDLVSRWQKCNSNKIGNDIYSIEFLCDKVKPPLFGAKYSFHLEGVVNCPEFLVHLPTFCKLASKYGLELVTFERFENYYERMKDEGKLLLSKMQALETYPPYHGVPLLGQPGQDYQHVIQYMQNIPNHRKVGTLSGAEWEVTSLYAVFVFQKLKMVRNSEGKPEYVKL